MHELFPDVAVLLKRSQDRATQLDADLVECNQILHKTVVERDKLWDEAHKIRVHRDALLEAAKEAAHTIGCMANPMGLPTLARETLTKAIALVEGEK